MPIGFSTGVFCQVKPYSIIDRLQQTLDYSKEYGLHAVELNIPKFRFLWQAGAEFNSLQQLLGSNDFQDQFLYKSLHMPSKDFNYPSPASENVMRNALALVKAGGINTVVFHPDAFLKKEPFYAQSGFPGLAAIENLVPPKRSVARQFSSIGKLGRFLNGPQAYKFVIDTEHLFEEREKTGQKNYQEDMVAGLLTALGKQIAHIHISAFAPPQGQHQLYSMLDNRDRQLNVLKQFHDKVMIHEGMLPDGASPGYVKSLLDREMELLKPF